MLIVQDLTYILPDNTPLFYNLNFSIQKNDKIGLVGNNGVGKSILLKLLSGELKPTAGFIQQNTNPYLIPQLYGQWNTKTVADVLNISEKINALHDILEGSIEETNFVILNDDWTIEERCHEILGLWGLENINLNEIMGNLSGGQKTKVLLAGIQLHNPDLILLDEPSNHLDIDSRNLLNNFIEETSKTLLIVSHDIGLLNLLNKTIELSRNRINTFGGNYTFYKQQKDLLIDSINQGITRQEKELKQVKRKSLEIFERQQKLDARGKRKQENSGIPKIMMNTLRNNAENSTSKLKTEQTEKILTSSNKLNELKKQLPKNGKIKVHYENSNLHNGKLLVEMFDINIVYSGRNLWKNNLSLCLWSGDRIAIVGKNASGKTSLLKLILNIIRPDNGSIKRNFNDYIYIDQDYSLLNPFLSVFEQIENFNQTGLLEHELKLRLNRYLFGQNDWNKRCSNLSGGERMRLLLCCMQVNTKIPDLIVLDEPTNNLDIQNMQILTQALEDYQGNIIVVSHDKHFLNQLNINRYFEINS